MAPFSALTFIVFFFFLYTILTAALIKFYERMNLSQPQQGIALYSLQAHPDLLQL